MDTSPFADIAEAAETLIEQVSAEQEVIEQGPLVHGLDTLSILCAAVIGYIGVVIMTYGAVKGALQFLQHNVNKHMHLSHIRIELGKHFALGLEFFVGKDIIESVVSPSWDDLGKLGAIVALRIVLTIFLSRELKEVEEELTVEKMERDMERPTKKNT